MDSRLERLIEKISDDKVILFCGPDVSTSSEGVPNSTALVQELMKRLEIPEESQTTLMLPLVAQSYVYQEWVNKVRNRQQDPKPDVEVVQRRKQKLARFISEHMDDPTIAPSIVHQQIVALPFRHIVTTNWDNLLEMAFNQQEVPFIKVVRDPDLAYVEKETRVLIKLFGTVEQAESLAITLDDLRKLPERVPDIIKFLNYSSSVRVLAFLGFDSAEYELRNLYEAVIGSTMSHKPRVVMIQDKPLKDSYWERLDVEFIEQDMSRFLQYSCKALGVSLPTSSTEYPIALELNNSKRSVRLKNRLASSQIRSR